MLAVWGMVAALAMNTTDAPESTRQAVHAGLALAAFVSLVLLGGPLVQDTWNAVRRRKLTLEPLFVSALLGALAYSITNTIRGDGSVYFETVTIVLVIFTLGREFKSGAQARATAALNALNADPQTYRVLRDGQQIDASADEIQAGDEVIVTPGDEIPVDATVLSGKAFVDTASVTGEPFPISASEGDRVSAGSHCLDGSLRVSAACDAASSTFRRSTHSIPSELANRAGVVIRAHRVLRWFIPAVWLACLATATGWWFGGSPDKGLMSALAVLLVACPCALGFATATAIWAACTRLNRLGIRVSDPDIVEALAHTRVFAFDKTGTITRPSEVDPEHDIEVVGPVDRPWLLTAIATAEDHSRHPIATTLRQLPRDRDVHLAVDHTELVPGEGFVAHLHSERGDQKLSLLRDATDGCRQAVRVELDDVHVATVILRESPESAWPSVAEGLKAHNARVVLLTGDGPSRAQQVPADESHAALTPSDKQRLVTDYQDRFGAVTFVGDGVNDAVAMSSAEGSVAIVGGSDLAGAVAQAHLPAAGLDALPEAVRIARSAQRVLRTNIAISITYNMIGIAVAAAGWLHPAFAAVLMVASSVIVTARSLSVAEEHGTQPHRNTQTEIAQPRLAPLPQLTT